jgi:hypothetical protein
MKFYNFSDSDYGGSLPRQPAPCLLAMMDLTADVEQTYANHTITPVQRALQFEPGNISTVELAFANQELYDIRINQRMQGSSVPLVIFEQNKWSDNPAQSDDEVRPWMRACCVSCIETFRNYNLFYFSAGKVNDCFVNQPNAVFIYFAARRIRDLRNKDAIHPANAILMDQDDLERCYGSTIMSAHAMVASTARVKRAQALADRLSDEQARAAAQMSRD